MAARGLNTDVHPPGPRARPGAEQGGNSSDRGGEMLRGLQSERPQVGDVLVCHATATVEHEICIVPESPHIVRLRRTEALAQGRKLAERLQVDAWLTEDHYHFLRICSFRSV